MIYFDNAATTYAENKSAIEDLVGNPSAPYSLGRKAKQRIEDARSTVAKCLGARPDEIIFTSGGSEGDNLAIKGVAFANRDRGNHIITTQIEHSAVINACKWLEKQGFEVTYLPVDSQGFVDPNDVAAAINNKTILVSIMMANNEIGTIQPIKEIGKLIPAHVYYHTDAVQAFGSMIIDVYDLGVDLLTISGHKFYAPKGVGALYVRRGTKIDPLIHGGDQEFGLRGGTENVESIIAMGDAAEGAYAFSVGTDTYLSLLRERLIEQLLQRIPRAKLNGPRDMSRRLLNNINLLIPGVPAETLILRLDMKDIYVSSGAACTSDRMEPSRVLKAIGLTDDEALSSIRITIGKYTSKHDVDVLLTVLPEIVSEIRQSAL